MNIKLHLTLESKLYYFLKILLPLNLPNGEVKDRIHRQGTNRYLKEVMEIEELRRSLNMEISLIKAE